MQSVRLNKSQLSTLISKAELKDSADYTWDKYLALNMAIVSAKEIYETAESQLQVDKQIVNLSKALSDLVFAHNIEKGKLNEVITLALERKQNQDAWNALTVKVPEHFHGRLTDLDVFSIIFVMHNLFLKTVIKTIIKMR